MENHDNKIPKDFDIEAERAELERQKEELLLQRAKANIEFNRRYNENHNNDENYHELDDIRIDKNSSNKQKYILLGFILVLLFLITLVTIKLISEPVKTNDYVQNTVINEQNNESISNSMDNNIAIEIPANKELESEKNTTINENGAKTEEISNSTTQKDEISQNTQAKLAESSKNSIFGIDKSTLPKENIEQSAQKKQIEVGVKQEKIKADKIKNSKSMREQKNNISDNENQKQNVQKKDEHRYNNKIIDRKSNSSSIENITFIQAGAFTAVPDEELIKTLKKNNFKYTFKKVEINGKIYSKLFIGGYKSKEKAIEDLQRVRNTINSKAFIPKEQ